MELRPVFVSVVSSSSGTCRVVYRYRMVLSHSPMKHGLALCPWATATLIMLCNSPVLSVALILRQARLLRSPNPAQNYPEFVSSRRPYGRAISTQACAPIPAALRRRKGLRRGRSCMIDVAGQQGRSGPAWSTRAAVPPPPLRTAVDTALPFGRLVGVELDEGLSLDDAVRAATAELMPEEVRYCSGLPPSVQVSAQERLF